MYDKKYTVGSGPASGILKPRYKVITTILGDDFKPENGVDVFIDLNTFINSLSTYTKYQQSLPFSETAEADLVSSILMILKHWKDYFRKYDNTRLFLIMNDFEINLMPEQKIIKSYMIPHVNKYRNDKYNQFVYYFTEAVKRVEVVLKYVPNSYIINCKRFDSYVIPNIIDDYETSGRTRVIISGSSIMTNYSYMKNTKVIYTQFKRTGMVQMTDPLMIVKNISKIEEDIMDTFIMNKVFYNILNCIIGDFDRGIIGLIQAGLTSFAVNLLRSVEKGEIPKDPKSIDIVLPVIDEKYHDFLKSAYQLMDIETHTKLITPSLVENVKSNMIDLYDIDGLKNLTINGLNLLELL